MSDYSASLEWLHEAGEGFTDNQYHRRHTLRFDGGAVWTGSSAPASVPVPLSDPAAVDPEEMFIASLSSCHMLWFLSLAARAGYTVLRYTDDAVGTLARNSQGRMAMTVVTLRPKVEFGASAESAGAPVPSSDQLVALHHQAHERCYIANSVNTDVRIEAQP
jgi:organic hydroperoxide reductase OsmC/OhrA